MEFRKGLLTNGVLSGHKGVLLSGHINREGDWFGNQFKRSYSPEGTNSVIEGKTGLGNKGSFVGAEKT